MSVQKFSSNTKHFPTKSFQSIYESRICSPASRVISSYPLCSPAGKKANPMIMSSRKPFSNLQFNDRRNESKDKQIQFTSPLRQKSRPKSLDFKNNLFEKLASKIQNERTVENKRNDEVISEYYDSFKDKQNANHYNLHEIRPETGRQLASQQTQRPKPTLLKESRYQKGAETNNNDKCRIKFNKTKGKGKPTAPGEEMDLVRTSESDFKASKNSLEMRPIY